MANMTAKQLNFFDNPDCMSSTVIDQDADHTENEIGNQTVKKLRPIGDRILVRVKAAEAEPLINGVYRPDITVEKPQEGIVVAVGKGRIVNGERIPVDVTLGEEVVFGKYSGNEIEVSGEKLLLLQESELMGEFYWG